MKRTAKISDILRPLSQAPTQAYISNALQVADILEWLLSVPWMKQSTSSLEPQTSSLPTIYQTTFSISEEFLRRTFFIKQKHPAKFIVIIDRKALQKTRDLWRFISQVYDEVYIADNHSKILLIDHHDGRRAAMVTSQNLTRGNRAESSVISSEDCVFFPLLEAFNDIRKNHSAPMHELMPTSNAGALEPRASSLEPILDEIEQMAGLYIAPSDIATVLDIPVSDFRDMINDPDHPVARAYRRGKAKAKIALRGQEMQLAQIGSPLGLQSVRENLLEMESDE